MKLRLQGLSYSQIKDRIPAGKGTLHYWLRHYPLSLEQKNKLYERRDIWVENFRETMRKKREEVELKAYLEQKKIIGRITKRDLMMLGVGLYWGEGQKGGSSVSVSNTDPRIILFSLLWLEKCFGISRTSSIVKIYTHLYSDMDIKSEIGYWKKTLGVERKQFTKPYIKLSKKSELDYKGFGHGTCRIQVASAKIKRQITATMKIFAERAGSSAVVAPSL